MNGKNISIAFISRFFCVGGVPRSYLSIAEGLQGKGFDFHIINIYKDDFQERFKSLGKCVYMHEANQIINYLRDNNISIAHTNNCDRGSYLAYLAGVPRIMERLAGINTAFLFDRKPVDCIVASTDEGFNFSKNEYPDKYVERIYNGVDLTVFSANKDINAVRAKLNINADDVVIGYCGRISMEKCIEDLVEAFAKVMAENKKVKLLLVGTPYQNYIETVRNAVDNYNISDNVIFYGETERPEEVVPAFDIGAITSGIHLLPDGTVRKTKEGLSNSVMEYMAAGLPVVATDSGELPVLVRDGINGFVVPMNDVSAISSKLSILSQDRKLRMEMGGNGRKIAQNEFSLNKMASNYERVYRFLVSGEFSKKYPDSRKDVSNHFLGNMFEWEGKKLSGKKVLVFRSGSKYIFDYILDDIRHNFLNPYISVFCNQNSLSGLSGYSSIDELIVYNASERFDVAKAGDLIDIINTSCFDYLYFISNDFYGGDCDNILKIASALNIDRKIIVSCLLRKFWWGNSILAQPSVF